VFADGARAEVGVAVDGVSWRRRPRSERTAIDFINVH
jgi:hypothetical protein